MSRRLKKAWGGWGNQFEAWAIDPNLISHGIPMNLLEVVDQLGELVVELHRSPDGGLGIAVTEKKLASQDLMRAPSWVFRDGWLEFASVEIRNQCVASYLFRKLKRELPELDAAKVFEVAASIWRHEIGQMDAATGRFIALACENSNVFRMATGLISSGKGDVFDVLHVVEAALAYVSIEPESLLELVIVQHEKTKNDLAGGMLFSRLEKVLIGNSIVAWDLYRLARDSRYEACANIYVAALMALASGNYKGAAISSMLEDAKSDVDDVAGPALWAIARTVHDHEPQEALKVECIGVVRNAITSKRKVVRESATRALAHMAVKERALLQDLLELSGAGNEHALALIADFLFFHLKHVREQAVFPELLRALADLRPEMKRSLDNFDWALSRLIVEPDYEEIACECLTSWIAKNGSPKLRNTVSIEHFDNTLGALAKEPLILAKLLTGWLVSDKRELAAACGGAVSFLWVRDFRSPAFSKCVIDELDAKDLMLLARRMLGYVIAEEALISMTLSLLSHEMAEHRTYGLVHNLLVNEVGRDYPESTIAAIRQYLDVGPTREHTVLNLALETLSKLEAEFGNLPRLNELRPPSQLRRALALRRASEMRASMDKADERSVFRQLVTQIHLKAGVGCFSVDAGKVGEINHLHSISQEVRLPRRSIIDPVGYALAGLHFRLASRDDV